MAEGDEWKRKADHEAWNAPEKIALDEYTSILTAHYNHVLRPLRDTGDLIELQSL